MHTSFYSFSFSDPPNITHPQTPTVRANETDKNITKCEADASPPAEYVWTNSTGQVFVIGGNFPLIDEKEVDDKHFTCKATNDLASDFTTILVQITSKFFKHFWIQYKELIGSQSFSKCYSWESSNCTLSEMTRFLLFVHVS